MGCILFAKRIGEALRRRVRNGWQEMERQTRVGNDGLVTGWPKGKNAADDKENMRYDSVLHMLISGKCGLETLSQRWRVLFHVQQQALNLGEYSSSTLLEMVSTSVATTR